MALEFSGPATCFADKVIEHAPDEIGCPVAAVQAARGVESRGGFLRDGRPKILVERACISRLTKDKYNQSNSHGVVQRAMNLRQRKRQLDAGEAVERIDEHRFRVAATGEILIVPGLGRTDRTRRREANSRVAAPTANLPHPNPGVTSARTFPTDVKRDLIVDARSRVGDTRMRACDLAAAGGIGTRFQCSSRYFGWPIAEPPFEPSGICPTIYSPFSRTVESLNRGTRKVLLGA